MAKGKNEPKESISQKLGFPAEGFFGARIELHSDKEAIIEGCSGVTDYYENRIKFNIGNGTVMFTGDRLTIVSYIEGCAIVHGQIISVEFGS